MGWPKCKVWWQAVIALLLYPGDYNHPFKRRKKGMNNNVLISKVSPGGMVVGGDGGDGGGGMK